MRANNVTGGKKNGQNDFRWRRAIGLNQDMSGRERPEKRKAAIVQDEARADGIKVALEELKKRYKTLHVTTCEYAQEIIELRKELKVLQKRVSELEPENEDFQQ